MIFHDREW